MFFYYHKKNPTSAAQNISLTAFPIISKRSTVGKKEDKQDYYA